MLVLRNKTGKSLHVQGGGVAVEPHVVSSEHGVEHDPAIPGVYQAAHIEHQIIRSMFEPIRGPEIRNDNIPMPIEEDVLRLQVAVDDFFLMDVPHARDELGEELGGVVFAEVAVNDDVLEEIPARGVIEDEPDVFVGFYHVEKPNNVGVFEAL